MPKVKVKRKSTVIDMTAMRDVTGLLLTFFMLTSTFVQKEPVIVSTPASVSEIKIPEVNVLQILIDHTGKVFLGLDKQEDRVEVLKKVGEHYGIEFTREELDKFKLMNSYRKHETIPGPACRHTGRQSERLRRTVRQPGQPVQSMGKGSPPAKRERPYHSHKSGPIHPIPPYPRCYELPSGPPRKPL